MSAFSQSELAGMQAAQEAHMMDTCTIDVYTDAGADVFGNPNPSWVSGNPQACGFQDTDMDEVLDAADVPTRDAVIRLPIGTAITAQDRITITHRHGVAVTNVTYEVVGEPRRGPSGIRLNLQKVTDGS